MSLRIVIVGGVAAGMSAATRARRMNESASIIVLEKGEHISFANCGLPYYVAGTIDSSQKLLITTPEKVAQRFNVEARVRHEVKRIDRTTKSVTAIDQSTGRTIQLPYDKLILAPGASPIVPPIEHVGSRNVFLLRSMEDALAVDAYLRAAEPKSVVVIGAGFIGLEMAEAMIQRGLRVVLVEKAPHALPPLDAELAPLLERKLVEKGIDLRAGVGLESLEAADGAVTAVRLEDGSRIVADLVLLSIGVRPNVALASEAGLVIGKTGAIAVDEYQRTSDPDIYAVGDASEVIHGVTGQPARIPLAGPANRQGRLAGEHAATGQSQAAARVMGTAIVQVFDLAIGITGLGEEAARKAGLDVDSAYVLPANHATYFPGSKGMRIKLVYEKATGRILGAQVIGGAGVDKRVDVIATAIHFNGTIDDLAQLDLAYAPQFGSAKDPVHMAAFVAQNQRRQTMAALDPSALNGPKLVDVRTASEFAQGTLPGAVNIPVDQLRERVGELDPEAPTITFCQVGMRGYVAQRILQQRGFKNVKNLKGGYAIASLLPRK